MAQRIFFSCLLLAAPLSVAGETIQLAWTAGFSDPSAREGTAMPGDTLVFNWGGWHNVYQMKGEGCNFSGADKLGQRSGVQWTVPMDAKPGDEYYFACSVGSHCSRGQKLTLTVGGVPEPEEPAGDTIQLAWTAGFSDANAREGTAKAGDTLVFNWGGGHNVEEMKAAGCDFTGSTLLGSKSGVSWTVPSDAKPGDEFYFACSISSHCTWGQRLTLTIEASEGDEATVDPTGTPTASPTASPTAVPTDVVVPGGVMVEAQLVVGAKNNRRKNTYWSKNGATISFEVDGVWTEPEDFFDSCEKADGNECPAAPEVYGPFEVEPTSVKLEFKDRLKANGNVAPPDNLMTGDLMIQMYPEDDSSNPTEVCTNALHQSSVWMDKNNPTRTYTFPEKCPCQELSLRHNLAFNLDPLSFTRTQRITVGIYYECREEWKEWTIAVQSKTRGIVANNVKRNIKEYPTKIRVTDARGDAPTITMLEYKIIPNKQTPKERWFIRPPKDAGHVLDTPFEAPMTYSRSRRRIDLQEPGHVLEEMFDDELDMEE